MPKGAKSEAARYVDQLEKLVLATRPLDPWRFSFWHALSGAFTGIALGFCLGLYATRGHVLPWQWLLAGALICALLFALGGRLLWNRAPA